MNIVIEPECVDDIVAVRNVVRRAFRHHQSVADMVDLIRTSPQYVPELALTARISRDVGFVMLSHAEDVEADGARHDVLTLSPLAVAPDHQRQGIGSALVGAGLAAADATGRGLVTLEGSPTYYGRLGFPRSTLSAMTLVFVDDVDAAIDPALAGGGDLVDPAVDQPWGLRQAIVADPGRHLWELSTYIRDVAPGDWGAELINP